MSNEGDLGGKESHWKTENFMEEESKCLERGSGDTDRNERFRAMFGRFKGNTVLSPAVKVALIVLGILCILLFITIIVLAAYWPYTRHVPRCSSPDCLTLSAVYLKHMDNQAEPCSNTRRWACGKWLDDNSHMLQERASWSVLDEIRLQDLRRLRDRITSLTPLSEVDSLEWKIKTLYDSCVALNNIEADDKRPLEKLIADLGGSHVMRKWNKRSWDWQDMLVKLHANYGVSPLFSVTVAWLPGTNETCFHLKPSGLGLPDPSFYNGGSESKPVKAYKGFLKDAALILDASSADALFFVDDVFAFEQRLATVMAEDMFKEKVYTLAELNEAEKFMKYPNLLREMFPEVKSLPEQKILVSAPNYITRLSAITTSTDSRILNSYFTWTLIRAHLPYMSQNFQLVWREFQSQITGEKKDLPRWEFCTDFVLKAMPLASLALLEDDPEINLNKDDTNEESVQRVFETICTAAVDQITTSSNLDENYKSVALKEIDGLTLQIGLKSHAKTREFLNKYYSPLSVQIQNFFANLNNILDFERRLIQQSYIHRNINIIRESSNHLVQMKVVYNRFVRAVIIPTSLLQSPYYHASYPRDVQYARIGVPIGKAIAEAIDVTDQNTGASLKKYGANTVYCLHGLLSNTTRWIGTRDETDVVAKTAYLEVIGGTLAELASRRTEDEHTLLPELEQYSGDGLFALSLAETMCSLHVSEHVDLDGINLKITGETLLNVVWPQIPGLRESLNCGVDSRCSGPF